MSEGLLVLFILRNNKDILINSQTSSFRCPSHYNSESIEVLLCNEHMTQVDLRININYPRFVVLVENFKMFFRLLGCQLNLTQQSM